MRPLRGLQETRVATREDSGVLGLPSRRGLTPRGSLECNPDAEGSGAGGVQTAKASRKQSSLSGKEMAQGCIPQCSCLENPRDGGAWWTAVYGIAQSQTRLKQHSSSMKITFQLLMVS